MCVHPACMHACLPSCISIHSLLGLQARAQAELRRMSLLFQEVDNEELLSTPAAKLPPTTLAAPAPGAEPETPASTAQATTAALSVLSGEPACKKPLLHLPLPPPPEQPSPVAVRPTTAPCETHHATQPPPPQRASRGYGRTAAVDTTPVVVVPAPRAAEARTLSLASPPVLRTTATALPDWVTASTAAGASIGVAAASNVAEKEVLSLSGPVAALRKRRSQPATLGPRAAVPAERNSKEATKEETLVEASAAHKATSSRSNSHSSGQKGAAEVAGSAELAKLKAYFDGVDSESLAAAKKTNWIYIDPALSNSELETHLRRLHPALAASYDRYVADMAAAGVPGPSGNGPDSDSALSLAALARRPEHLALLFDIPL